MITRRSIQAARLVGHTVVQQTEGVYLRQRVRSFYLQSLLTGLNVVANCQEPERDSSKIESIGQPTHKDRKHIFDTVSKWTQTSFYKRDKEHQLMTESKGNAFNHEVVPGIPLSVFQERRRLLMRMLPERSIAVIIGNSLRYTSENIFYPFTQNTEMQYLCGYNMPDSVMVLIRNSSCDVSSQFMHKTTIEEEKHKNEIQSGEHLVLLFVNNQRPEAVMWEGKTVNVGDVGYFGADQGFDISGFEQFIRSIPSDHLVFTNLPPTESESFGFKLPTRRKFSTGINVPVQNVRQIGPILGQLRTIKDDRELDMMRIAGDVSSMGHLAIMKHIKGLRTESDIEAVFDFACKLRGGSLARQGYVPVIASGKNALVLHYIHNNDELHDGDLIMIDAGFQFNGYHCDITRTIPRNGRFTPAQRELYDLVVDVQKKCITMVGSHVDQEVTLNSIHMHALMLFQEGLSRLFERTVSMDEVRKLFNHHIGHYVGLDLHDTVNYSRSCALRNGNVITVEPGLYVPAQDEYPKRFHGIGIRVEDTVAIVPRSDNCPGFEVLSAATPKEIVDIEKTIEHGGIDLRSQILGCS